MLKTGVESLKDYELYCESRLADPYPLFSRLREEDPVHWSEQLGSWLITRYDDVYAGLNNLKLASDRAAAYMNGLPEPQRTSLRPLGEHVSNWLGFTDPPKHTRMRKLVGAVFTPRLAENLRPRIQAIVDGLLDKVASTGHMEIIKDLAYPLPATVVVCEILGITPDHLEQFKAWLDDINAFIGGFGPLSVRSADQACETVMELESFLRDLFAERRRHPRDDMLSSLIAAQGQEDGLSEQELLGLCTFLFSAGEETTLSLIGNSAYLLLTHPEARETLQKQPELMKTAIEEFLRYESPIQITTRQAADDVEMRGRRIRKGQAVTLVQGSADRDPEQFPEPDRLDLARKDNRHLAFGWGIHFCLGAPLARIEGHIAIKSLLERFPNMHLEGGDLHWRENLTIRCLKSLPVVF